MPANYRRNMFTDADESVQILREPHTVPAASPFEVMLGELPRQDSPESIAVRSAPTQVTLSPDVDTYLDEDNPGNNNGSEPLLDVGRQTPPTGTGRRRALLSFSVASVSGTVVSAKLRVWLSVMTVGTYPAACPIGLHRVTGAWTGATKWGDQPGYDPVAIDVVTVYGSGYYEWDVSDLVAGWLAGTWDNFGVVLITGDESEGATGTIRSFGSVDNGTADYRPLLNVESAGTTFTLVDRAITPAPGECGASYPYGALRFHEDDGGTAIEVDYWATGSPILAEHVTPLGELVGNGEDGDLSVTTGTTTLAGGWHRLGSLYVAPGATLQLTGPVTVIGCTGSVEIHGTLDLAGRGYAGGAAGQDGKGFGGVGGRGGLAGGGGGGSSTDGQDGNGGRGGDAHPSRAGLFWRQAPLLAGGGGGGAGAAGGNGGGALLLQALGSVTIPSSAVITAAGAAGTTSGGGGGAGGCVVIRANSRVVEATPILTGGTGADNGGDGAPGWYIEEGL